MILDELNEYASPRDKLSRMVRDKAIFPIVKGLYETEAATPGYLLAGSIYGPSYLSFEFALSYYGLIPEAVYTVTSATFEKKKKKRFKTAFGVFTYQDIPAGAFPLGINLLKEGAYACMIASPEKAICDQLYKTKPITNQKRLQTFLLEDLRIEETEIKKLNVDDIVHLAKKYHSTNITRFSMMMQREKKHGYND